MRTYVFVYLKLHNKTESLIQTCPFALSGFSLISSRHNCTVHWSTTISLPHSCWSSASPTPNNASPPFHWLTFILVCCDWLQHVLINIRVQTLWCLKLGRKYNKIKNKINKNLKPFPCISYVAILNFFSYFKANSNKINK